MQVAELEGILKTAQDRTVDLQGASDRNNGRLDDACAVLIADWLQRPASHQCKTLNLRNNTISCNGVTAIAKALHRNETLKRLDLRGNRIGARGAQELIIAVLAQNDNRNSRSAESKDRWIEFLLGDNRLGNDGLAVFSCNLNAWKTLDLSSNHIDDVTCLTDKLVENESLVALSLSHNHISVDGAEKLKICLRTNRTLLHLNLSATGLTTDACTHLGELLRSSQCSLTQLDLNQNPDIRDAGAKHLADGLSENKSVRSFQAIRIGMEDSGVEHFGRALRSNRFVQEFNVTSNQLNERGILALREALKVNTSITTINYSTSASNESTEGKVALREMTSHIERNINHRLHWEKVAILITWFRANRGHSFMHSVQPLVPSILRYESENRDVVVQIQQPNDALHSIPNPNQVAPIPAPGVIVAAVGAASNTFPPFSQPNSEAKLAALGLPKALRTGTQNSPSIG